METLDIASLEKDASSRMEVAALTKKLQALLTQTYPGYVVQIVRGEMAVQSSSEPTFDSLRQVEQIQQVLKSHEQGMTLADLFAELQKRGSRMSDATLQSLLSKYKTNFNRVSRGVYRLAQ